MPTSVIKAWAGGSKKKEDKLENKWDKAKEAAGEEGHKNNYAYRMAIFKKMAHREDLRGYVLSRFFEQTELSPEDQT